jgi:hypothetical protein
MRTLIERQCLAKVFGIGVVWGTVLLVAGCGGDTTGPSSRSLYWQLQLNHHAVTLATVAPYDTIQLTATPLDVTGAPIATTVQPVYTTSDTSITIDSTGFVRVHRTGSSKLNITVVAKLVVGGPTGSTLVDTAVVNVVNVTGTIPTLDSLLLRPVVGDSARRAVIDTAGKAGVSQTLDSMVAKMGETKIVDAMVHYASSDPLIASFASPNTAGTPKVNANAPGVVLLTAEATVYGTTRVDSLWYTVGYPLQGFYSYGLGEMFFNSNKGPLPTTNALSVGTLTVGQGAAVLWGNSVAALADDSLDVQFDASTGVVGLSAPATFTGVNNHAIKIPAGSGGNIPAFPAETVSVIHFGRLMIYQLYYDSLTSKARVFSRPGTYHWVSKHQGIAGNVVVVSNDSLHPK